MEQQDDPVVWNLLDRAGALPPDRREAFPDAACAGDADRRARVEALPATAAGRV